jgi:DNA-binding NtrC family response regulator
MRNKHHVLIVNAAPHVAMTLEHKLELAGYHVSCAAHLATALHHLAGERVDAVILDAPIVDTPILDTECRDMVGPAMLQALRLQWPQARVLLVSDADAAVAMQGIADTNWRLLRRPVTAGRLKQCLQDMLPPAMTSMPDRWYEYQRDRGSAVAISRRHS